MKELMLCLVFVLIIAVAITAGVISNKPSPPAKNNPSNSFSVTPDTNAHSNTPLVSVTGLSDAHNRCLSNSNCKSFVYSESGKTMKIVDLKSGKFKSNGTHLYTLQMGVQIN